MKLRELIENLQEKEKRIGDVDVIVRSSLGFMAGIEDVTDETSFGDNEPYVAIDFDETDPDNYEVKIGEA